MDNNDIKIIRTACPAHCGIDCCGILAHVKGGKVVKLEPAEFPLPNDRRICLRGLSSLDITYHPDRLKYPMRRVGNRGDGEFERISWETAFDIIAKKFKSISKEYGWKSIGWVLGGPGAGTTKFGAYLRLASLTQSTRVSAWGYGDAGVPCGSRIIFGSQFPYMYLFGTFWQRKWPDLIVVWGSNPAEAAPLQTMRKILDAKENGTQLVVIDPRYTITASKADVYVGLKPGTDSALALGLMNIIFKKGLYDENFIRHETNGTFLVRIDNGKFLRGKDIGEKKANAFIIWDESSGTSKILRRSTLKTAAITGEYDINGIKCKTALQMLMDLAEDYPPDKTAEITGVSQELITKLSEKIGTTEKITFFTWMGFTRTYYGDISLRGMISVAAITGNVTTSISSGYIPAVLNWDPFLKAIPDKPSFHRMGILNLYEAVISGKPYPIKALWFAFINFLNQCVDCNKIIKKFLPNLDFIVQTELFMTPTAKYADILLPVCSFLEFSDFLPHPYPYVQLQQKIIDPLYESKSDVNIVAGLAEKLGFEEYFQGGEDSMIDLIMDHSSLEGYTKEKLSNEAMLLRALPEDSNIPLPFSTLSGKIELYAEQLTEDGQGLPVYLPPIEAPISGDSQTFPIALIEGHSRFRTHSMFANVKSLLDINPEPIVDINPIDASKRDVKDGDWVTILNNRGSTTLKARISEGVRPGVIDLTEGWWIEQFKKGSLNHLTHDKINPVQNKVYEPNMHMNDVAVEVKKFKEGEK